MRSRKSVVGSVVVTAALGAGVIGAAGPVQATSAQRVQPVQHSQQAAQAQQVRHVVVPNAAARMCVKTYVANKAHGYVVRVTNRCGRTVKVKIIMRLAKDSRCFTLKKGQSRYRETQGIGTWKKTVFC